MEKPESYFKAGEEHLGCLFFKLLVFSCEDWFGCFKEDIAKLILPEIMEALRCKTELIVVELEVDLGNGVVESGECPGIGECECVELLRWGIGKSLDFRECELGRLPDFVAELTVADNTFDIEVDVGAFLHVGEESEPECI